MGISSFDVSKRIQASIDKEVKAVFKIETFTKQAVTISNEINETLPIKINETVKLPVTFTKAGNFNFTTSNNQKVIIQVSGGGQEWKVKP